MQRKIILFASAISLALGHAASAQQPSAATAETSLYSEMWALAGVCNQLAGYRVEQDTLAAFLNDQRNGVDEEIWRTVAQGRAARLDTIEDEVARIRALPRGFARQHAVDENAANLMSRCNRLSNSDTAGRFFRRAG
ncbi:MAG: hypothetical protein WA957_04720 [Alteraurantiacibacter sp.]